MQSQFEALHALLHSYAVPSKREGMEKYMKKVTVALVAAVLMSVSSVDAAVAPAKQPGMMSNMMNYGKKAMAGASKMGGQAVAGAKSMMAPKAPVANAPAAQANPAVAANKQQPKYANKAEKKAAKQQRRQARKQAAAVQTQAVKH